MTVQVVVDLEERESTLVGYTFLYFFCPSSRVRLDDGERSSFSSYFASEEEGLDMI